MYDRELEMLIDAALVDGILTDKEKRTLIKKAATMGVDVEEFEMVLDARVLEMKKNTNDQTQEKGIHYPNKEKYKYNSDKIGERFKCPNCGATLQRYFGKCSECGYELENKGVNPFGDQLAMLVQSSSNEDQVRRLIEMYPIPTTKSDLIDFILWLKPLVVDTKNPLFHTYTKKYEECIEKIQLIFPKDTLLTPFVSEYEQIKKKVRKQRFANLIKHILSTKVFWVLFLFLTGVVLCNTNTEYGLPLGMILCGIALLSLLFIGIHFLENKE